jgi:hypothetical protein
MAPTVSPSRIEANNREPLVAKGVSSPRDWGDLTVERGATYGLFA